MAFNPTNPNGQATSANSAPVVLSSDQSAIAIKGNLGSATTTSWTSATTLNTVSAINVNVYNAVSVTMSNTSTMTAGVLSFEISPDSTTGSDGNWFALSMARVDSFTTETTYTLNTVANRAWTTSIDGFKYFRVRLSTVITGTGTATINITPQTFAIEPMVTVGQATAANLNATVTGTVTANLGTGGTSTTSLGKAEDAASASGDTGVFILGVRRDAAVVSASTTGDYNEIRTDQYGQQAVVPGVSGTETITRVTAATSSTVLLAANTSRKGASFYNESTSIAYLKRGTTASVTSYTVQIPAGGYYELPQPIHQGGIDCIWAAANGAMQITEVI